MPVNRRIPPPPPAATMSSSSSSGMSSTPYYGAASSYATAKPFGSRFQRVASSAASRRNAAAASRSAGEVDALAASASFGASFPSLLDEYGGPLLAVPRNSRALVQTALDSHCEVATTYRNEIKSYSDDTLDEIGRCFQALADRILSSTSTATKTTKEVRRHPDFPDSTLDPDVIDGAMRLTVAQLKAELSRLHGISPAEVARYFGGGSTKKGALQHRLLTALQHRQDAEEKAQQQEQEEGDARVADDQQQHPNVPALQPPAPTAADVAATTEPAEPLDVDSDDDEEDNGSLVEVVPAEEEDEEASAGPKAEAAVGTMSAHTGALSRLQSPPKVSETTDEQPPNLRNDSSCDSSSSSSFGETEEEQDPVGHAQSASATSAAAVASNSPTVHRAEKSEGKHNPAVDTTVASVPFDEATATAAAEMEVDANADDQEMVMDAKLDPVLEVDSGRKRSRSPFASSSSPIKVRPSSASGKENDSAFSSTAAAFDQVQTTFNNLSFQQSPLRKFAKVNDNNGGAVKASTFSRSNSSAPEEEKRDDDHDFSMKKSQQDPGPSWLDKRNAQLELQSSIAPKPARPAAAVAAAATSKLYADEKFPSAMSYQPPAPASSSSLNQPRLMAPKGAAAAKANPYSSNLVEKMRNKSKIFPSNAAAPSVGKSFRPSPIVDVIPYRSAAAGAASEEERRKAMNSKVRQKALESKGAAARAQYLAQTGNPHKPALPMARPSPVTKVPPALTSSTYSSPAVSKNKWNPSSAKKTLASAVKKLSPHQAPPASPAYESYPMTDSEEELSDEDEYNQGRARKPAKRYPAWTHPQALAATLQRQYSDPEMDPDVVFGDFSAQTCDLVAIFGDEKERYKRRGSSGNWTNDRLTDREKHEFMMQRHQPALTRPF